MTDLVRRDIPALRRTMRALGIVVAEVDTALRYVWIENPHPDFEPEKVVGKRDDELVPAQDSVQIMALKQQILDTAQGARKLLTFDRSDGAHHYIVHGHPVLDVTGRVEGVVTFGFEITSTQGIELATTALELSSRASESSAI